MDDLETDRQLDRTTPRPDVVTWKGHGCHRNRQTDWDKGVYRNKIRGCFIYLKSRLAYIFFLIRASNDALPWCLYCKMKI